LTLSRFVDKIPASIDGIPVVFWNEVVGREDVAPRFHRGLTAWATVLHRRGVL